MGARLILRFHLYQEGQVLARSRDDKNRKDRNRLFIAIPLIALAVVAAVYVVSVLPQNNSVPVNFTDELLIETQYQNSSTLLVVAPNSTIGEPGGLWKTNQYDSFGVNGYYPLYMDLPKYACPSQHACTIHVKSSVVHQYTLGDFMAVWGYPIVSRNDTLGTKSKGTVAWELCIGASPNTAFSSNAWGALVLQPNMAITLEYYDTSSPYGCAAS
jgi:hypothetical protein